MAEKCACLLLCALLICNPPLATYEVDNASAHNRDIAAGLLGAKRLCNESPAPPSMGNAFSYAAIRAITPIPFAANVTSSNGEIWLLWGWGADYPESAVFQNPPGTACPGKRLEIFGATKAKLKDAALEYVFGGSKKEIPLGADGPNPALLQINASGLNEQERQMLLANLTIRLRGRISVDYHFRETEYRIVCMQGAGYSSCGCEARVSVGTREFYAPVSDERLFGVENGNGAVFFMNPPLKRMLDGKQEIALAYFSRNIPARISANEEGTELADVEPFRLQTREGECGEAVVDAVFSPESHGMGINRSAALAPFQLVSDNRTYLPYYLEFGWNASAGKRSIAIECEDLFSGKERFETEIFARNPSQGIAVLGIRSGKETAGMAVANGTESAPPMEYLPATNSIVGRGNGAYLPLLLAAFLSCMAVGIRRIMC